MRKIETEVKPEDVYLKMEWGKYKKADGTPSHPDMPEVEHVFQHEEALAILLLNEVVFLNSHWWQDKWPDEAKKQFSINVNCNDVFAWGCADGETLEYRELEDLYSHWIKDREYGAEVWCIKKRGELPQRPVYDKIKSMGIWDLDAMGLKCNYYDASSGIIARKQYWGYCEWAIANGETPVVMNKDWWSEWKRFSDANPDFVKTMYNDLPKPEGW